MRAVSIIATAAMTPMGLGPEALWTGLLSGESWVRRTHSPESGQQVTAALVPPEAIGQRPGEDRALALTRRTVEQLLGSPAWARVDPTRLGVFVGTTQGAIQTWTEGQLRLRATPDGAPPAWPWLADPARLVARLTGAGGPVECPSMACVSGTAALGLAAQWIRSGQQPRWAVAGGVDAFSDFVHAGFRALKAVDPHLPRPFDRRRAGLGAGEGAGLLLLEAGEIAGAPRLLGWGLGGDANHLTGPHPQGLGLSRAISAALTDGGVRPEALDHVNAHGTATVYNDLMEARALHHALGGEAAARVPVNSIKGAVGHPMAAAGALEAVVACLVLQRGMIPPTAGLQQPDPKIQLDLVRDEPRHVSCGRVLSTSAGFGGLNAALVLGLG